MKRKTKLISFFAHCRQFGPDNVFAFLLNALVDLTKRHFEIVVHSGAAVHAAWKMHVFAGLGASLIRSDAEELLLDEREKILLARTTGLMQLRGGSATESGELKTELLHADQALEDHWRGFMKTAAEVLNKQ